MDTNAIAERHGLNHGWCPLHRPTRPQASRLEGVVDKLLCQSLVELVLSEAFDIASSTRVKKLRIHNSHTHQRHVDPHRPILGNELMLESEVVLPAPIMAVDL